MSIKLLRFPIFVLIKILESMPSTHKVLISFCSSKMRNLIRMVKWHVFKINYICYRSRTHILLGLPTDDYGGCFQIRDVDEFTENSKIFREKTLGLQFGLFTYSVEGNTATVVQVLKKVQYFSRLVFHNLIIDLFRNPPVIEYDAASDSNLSKVYIYETMKTMCLSGEDVADANYVEEYFSKAIDLHCAVVTPLIRPRLNIDSKLTTAKYLYFKAALHQTMALALHFNGHRAVFKQAIFDESTIVDIVKKWKSNEGFQNLQTLEMYSSAFLNLRVDEIVQQFDAIPWDGQRRPENFEEDYRVMGIRFKPIKCADFLDIVRDSDGKVASFLVTETMFKFCVWN